MRARFTLTFLTLLLASACSSDKDGDKATNTGGKSSGSGGTGSSTGGTGSSTGGRPINFGGGPPRTGPMFAGAECPTDLGLSDAYALPNVKASVEGSNIRISFDPQGDAADYRVYALPKKADVTADGITGATYRCAGNSAVPAPAIDDATEPMNPGVRTRVASKVRDFPRTKDDATLGYVFTTPGDDRIPVYAMGDPSTNSDNVKCYFMRWPESRLKKYTTDEAERKDLLAKHWRDDGIAFYAPKPGTDGAEPIYYGLDGPPESTNPVYMKAGPEHDKRVADKLDLQEAFSVYSATQDGAEPLMRVFYDQACARGHDELVAGLGKFYRAYQQGPEPVQELHYSNVTEETTLVVEALDAQCPFQGIVSPTSRPARVDPFKDFNVNYPAFETPDELTAAAANKELFINGQGPAGTPKAIARACVKVKPDAAPADDFRYDGTPETFSAPVAAGFQIWTMDSPTFNVQFHTVATDEFSIGALLGELWVTYGDWAADTNGKLRISPKTLAKLADDTFVHASMEVDTVSTQRRYPQLIISDVGWPVQDNMDKGETVVIQTFGGITLPVEVEIEFCDHKIWDVNNQCPQYDLYTLKDAGGDFLAPRLEINGSSGVDRTVRFDAYVSTGRVYLYTNGVPYACVDLPDGKLKAGDATIVYGDSLYHSGVDLEAWYPFHKEKLQNITSRHYSDLAFSSGVPGPGWDEAVLPCVAASGIHN
jgi:Repeat of unknown function (DUF5648)